MRARGAAFGLVVVRRVGLLESQLFEGAAFEFGYAFAADPEFRGDLGQCPAVLSALGDDVLLLLGEG